MIRLRIIRTRIRTRITTDTGFTTHRSLSVRDNALWAYSGAFGLQTYDRKSVSESMHGLPIILFDK